MVLLFQAMTSIVGGLDRAEELGGTTAEVAPVLTVAADAPTGSELRLAEALLRCIARWGLSKTTIEDIAREAGMSRATAYRVFPGGKVAILDAASRSEVHRLLREVAEDVAATVDVEDCLVRVVHRASSFLHEHPAMRFMREHEPVVMEQYLGFDTVHALLGTAGDLLAPSLSRHFDLADARELGVWLARLVLSYLQTPADDPSPTDLDGARHLVRTFVLPGLPPVRPG